MNNDPLGGSVNKAIYKLQSTVTLWARYSMMFALIPWFLILAICIQVVLEAILKYRGNCAWKITAWSIELMVPILWQTAKYDRIHCWVLLPPVQGPTKVESQVVNDASCLQILIDQHSIIGQEVTSLWHSSRLHQWIHMEASCMLKPPSPSKTPCGSQKCNYPSFPHKWVPLEGSCAIWHRGVQFSFLLQPHLP